MSELKPCPFCGCRAIVEKCEAGWLYAKCEECLARGPKGNTQEMAEAWNRRTPQPVTPAGGEVPTGLIEALRHQEQCDEDGVMCIVSREAVDVAIKLLTQSPTPVADAALRDALVKARDWFESQAKAISKGCGSTWDLLQVREQRDLADAALNQRGGG